MFLIKFVRDLPTTLNHISEQGKREGGYILLRCLSPNRTMRSYIRLTWMQVVLRSMQELKFAVGMALWMRELLRGDSCAQVCGQGQGQGVFYKWSRHGHRWDVATMRKCSVGTAERGMQRGGWLEGSPGPFHSWITDVVCISKQAPLVSVFSIFSWMELQVSLQGASCWLLVSCSFNTVIFYLHDTYTRTDSSSNSETYALCPFPHKPLCFPVFPLTWDRDRNLRIVWNCLFLGPWRRLSEVLAWVQSLHPT